MRISTTLEMTVREWVVCGNVDMSIKEASGKEEIPSICSPKKTLHTCEIDQSICLF